MAENVARGQIAAPDRTTRAGWLRRECGTNRFTVRLNLSFGQMAPSTHGRPGGVAHSEWADPALVRPGRRPASPRLRNGRFWRKLPTRHLTLVTPKPPFEATVGGWRGVAQSLYNHRARMTTTESTVSTRLCKTRPRPRSLSLSLPCRVPFRAACRAAYGVVCKLPCTVEDACPGPRGLAGQGGAPRTARPALRCAVKPPSQPGRGTPGLRPPPPLAGVWS